ncbi:hypothetical protein HBI37_029980 [Parastagonospora nodorum]|nr:hypothetical protein HBH82_050120 [Parastagonospora nodorum]KAH4683498.1 hypothetical protein HBH78_126490 [Parastagonospora nodorum]KAH4711992.1 hypothetical protein HBH67_014480 [Parastagonospora nodorum]KAH4777057.1 hypothetical protein HBH63_137510 [Parastagonospora nodorum]KAH4787610.1 hypothetical protein HBH62_066600 [Parastagonospora nodorum]
MPCSTVPMDDLAPDAASRLIVALPLAEPSPPEQPHPVSNAEPSLPEFSTNLSPSEDHDHVTALRRGIFSLASSIASREILPDAVEGTPNTQDEGVDAEPISPRRIHMSAEVLRRIPPSAEGGAAEYIVAGLDNDSSSSDSDSDISVTDNDALEQNLQHELDLGENSGMEFADLLAAQMDRQARYRTQSPISRRRRLRAHIDYRIANPELPHTATARDNRIRSPPPTQHAIPLSVFLEEGLTPLMPSHPHYPGIGTTCPICYEPYSATHPPILITNIPGCRNHIFGYGCLRKTISSGTRNSNHCPLCRTVWFRIRMSEVRRIAREWEAVETRENGVQAQVRGHGRGNRARGLNIGRGMRILVERVGRVMLEYVDGMYS